MSLSLLQAKFSPDHGGLTPPSPGPHPAGGRQSGHVFWGILCREEVPAFLDWLRSSQQQLEMTPQKEKGQNSEGSNAAPFFEMTCVESWPGRTPCCQRLLGQRDLLSPAGSSARPPPPCTIASADLPCHPQAWHRLRGAHDTVGILPTRMAHTATALPSRTARCPRSTQSWSTVSVHQRTVGRAGEGKRRKKKRISALSQQGSWLSRTEQQRGGGRTGNPGKRS